MIGGGAPRSAADAAPAAFLPILSANNGYRFAKCEGESFVTIVEKCLQIAGFCDPAARAEQVMFRFDSSRCLNRDSNFTGHMIATSRQTANAYSAGFGQPVLRNTRLNNGRINRAMTGAALAAANIESRERR